MPRASGAIASWARKAFFVLAVLGIEIVLGTCGGTASPSPEQPAIGGDRFDAARTWRLIEHQVSAGQRPAGSPQLRKLAGELRPLLPEGRFEPIPGEPGIRNIVGTLEGREPAIVLGAHYDTLAAPPGFVGANNGAAGTAVVIEVARALQAIPTAAGARAVDFVLFDGEEPAEGTPEESEDFLNEGLRGSRAYVEAHPEETMAMILLDYVGNRGLHLPREANSHRGLWRQLLYAADKMGTERFFSAATGPAIADDHTPFLLRGVPAIDLIDWKYPGHSLADGLDRLSRKSLDAVGETITQLVLELRE